MFDSLLTAWIGVVCFSVTAGGGIAVVVIAIIKGIFS